MAERGAAPSPGRFVITDPNGDAHERRLALGRTSIGRHAGSDIVLAEDKSVSGRHAVVDASAAAVVVEDYDSTNGTRVNEQPTKKHALQDGDVVGIGRYTLRFRAGAPNADAPKLVPPAAGFAVLDGPGAGGRVALDRALTRVGRPGAQVAAVTTRHDGHYIAHVLGGSSTGGRTSTPPTLNGVPFGTVAVRLHPGDTVVVAGITLIFECPLQAEIAATPA